MDSSYQVQTNVSVERDIIWIINAHSMHKGEVLFLSHMYSLGVCCGLTSNI